MSRGKRRILLKKIKIDDRKGKCNPFSGSMIPNSYKTPKKRFVLHEKIGLERKSLYNP